MNRAVIEERIHAAIRPQLRRADHAILELITPETRAGRHAHDHSEMP